MDKELNKSWNVVDLGDDLIYISEKLDVKANTDDFYLEKEIVMLRSVIKRLEELSETKIDTD
nr:hypothetical protein [Mammaliicoccus sp. Marseille-Q6498]